MTIRLVKQYSVQRARDWIRGSLQANGEQAILLSMYHPKDNAQKCPNCTTAAYSGGSANCPICYGTSFNGGVRAARRVWAMFSDHHLAEKQSQRGVWAPDDREIQTEAFPELIEHDYVVRVRTWNLSGDTPLEIAGFYGVGAVNQESLRTGARYGQYHWDVIGQRAKVSRLQKAVKINDYPIVGVRFATYVWPGVQPTQPPVVP